MTPPVSRKSTIELPSRHGASGSSSEPLNPVKPMPGESINFQAEAGSSSRSESHSGSYIFAPGTTFAPGTSFTARDSYKGGSHHHGDVFNERPPSIGEGRIAIKHFPYFCGRDNKDGELETIKNHFDSNNQPALITLCGGPGVGKSAIAHKYADQHEEYDIFGVIDASSEIRMAQSFQSLGVNWLSNLPESLQIDNPPSNVIHHVLSRLHNHGEKNEKNILFIIENLDSRKLFNDYLSVLQKKTTGDKISRVHTIITTRQNSLAIPGLRITIENFDNKSAGKCMHNILQDMGRTNIGLEECEKLANDLDNNATAVTQAAAYLGNEKSKTVKVFRKNYTKLYKKAEEENKAAEEDDDKKDPSVYATFKMAIEKVEKMSPGASALLTFASFFGNESIPVSLLKPIKHSDSGSLKSFLTEDLSTEDDLELALSTSAKVKSALSALDRFCIIKLDDPEKPNTFSMDRLVQVVAQDSLRENNDAWKQCMVDATILAFPKEIDHANIGSIKDIVPYAQEALKQFPEGYEFLDSAHVHYLNAACHFEMGLHDIAKEDIRNAINIYEKASIFCSDELDRCEQLRKQIHMRGDSASKFSEIANSKFERSAAATDPAEKVALRNEALVDAIVLLLPTQAWGHDIVRKLAHSSKDAADRAAIRTALHHDPGALPNGWGKEPLAALANSAFEQSESVRNPAEKLALRNEALVDAAALPQAWGDDIRRKIASLT